MKQATLQLKNSIQNNVNIMNNNIEVGRFSLNIILSMFGALALFYVLILGNMVFNIVERRAMEKEALALSNEVGNLELSYLSTFNDVDVAMSLGMGYKEVRANFATRKSLGSLKLANNEI